MITQAISSSENRVAELAVLIEELTARLQAGEPVDLEEVVREHPEYAEEIKELLPAMALLVNLSCSAATGPAAHDDTAAPHAELGDFRILREVGRGGMGIVYEAMQVSLGRRVALKVLPRTATMDPRQLERFKNEAKAVASLRHEHIVHVYGVGCEAGVHYYAMQFIEGQTLAQHIGAMQLGGERRAVGGDATLDHIRGGDAPTPPAATHSTVRRDSPRRDFYRGAATLIMQAAKALDHAHSLGIVHRDVKPGNLLLDTSGGLWVSDFGLARLGADTGLTVTGDLLGTLRYMSPEQASGKHGLVDHRTDVYSLGVTLYELLTLRPAFTGEDREELLRQVTSEEPLPPRRLNGSIPAELETVALKAMAKEPSSRYPTAGMLAEDLQRFLAGEPIHARPVGRVERMWRWCRRNPAQAAASGLSVVAFVAVIALGLGSVFAVQLGEEQERTKAALLQAETQQEQTNAALQKAEAANAVADGYLRQTERLATTMTMERGLALCEYENAARGMLWLARSLEKAPAHAPDLQRASRANLAGWQHQIHRLKAVLQHHERIVMSAAYSPDGKTIATRDGNGTVRLWESATGKPVGVPMEHPGWGGWQLAFSPDGKTLATPGGASKTVRLWDASTGQPIGEPLVHPGNVRSADFSPDGKSILTINRDDEGNASEVRVWEVATGKTLFDPWQQALAAAFSPDGKTIITGSREKTAQLWDAATGKPLGDPLPHAGIIWKVIFSPDGKILFTAGRSRDGSGAEGRLWDAATRKPIGAPLPVSGNYAVVFSPDSQTVATSSSGGTAYLWEASTGNPRGVPLQHREAVWTVAFSPDSQTVVTGSWDRTARLWETATGKPIGAPLPHGGDVFTVAFSPDGNTILTASRESAARLWAVSPAKRSTTTFLHPSRVLTVAYSPDGKIVATAGTDNYARLWDVATGQPLGTPLKHDGIVWTVAFSPDSKTLVTGAYSSTPSTGEARLWDVATGNLQCPPLEHKGVRREQGPAAVWIAVFSPDGKTVATSTRGHLQGTSTSEAQLWDVSTGKPLGPPLQTKRRLWALAFSPDSKTILTGSWDPAAPAQRWDVATCQPIGPPLQSRGDYIHVAAFSPDGKTILAAGMATQLLETATGKHLTWLRTQGLIQVAAFSPDGKTVVTGGNEKIARLWDVATGKPLGKPMPHEDGVRYAAFSPDGKTVLTASEDRTARLWNSDTGDPLGPPVPNVENAVVSPDGKSILIGYDKTARLWQPTTPVEGDAARVALWTQVITGMELDSEDVVRVLDPKSWEQRRRRLAGESILPDGWLEASSEPDYYAVTLDRTVPLAGRASGSIKARSPDAPGSGRVEQRFRADDYRGKRLRLSGFVKSDKVDQRAGLWMRIEGDIETLGFDDMRDRPIQGTSDWKQYEIVLDVPVHSVNIVFGVSLSGQGQVWVDNLLFDVVSSEITTTNTPELEQTTYPTPPALQGKPLSLDFEN